MKLTSQHVNLWFVLCLLGISLVSHAADLGAASSAVLSRPGDARSSTYRVRIPVEMNGWTIAQAKTPSGKTQQTRIPSKPLRHVLRARLERPNDFYVGDWRIQSTPVRWLKQSKQYQVKLEVFQRYGEAGQIEESLGTMMLTGVLCEENQNTFALQGAARKTFADRRGEPLVEVVAGTPLAAPNKEGLISKDIKKETEQKTQSPR